MTTLLALFLGAQFHSTPARPIQIKLPADATLTKRGSHYAPIFSAKSGITVRTVFVGPRADTNAGKIPVQFSGPKRAVPPALVPALMKSLKGTNTQMHKFCIFHPDHLIEIPVGKEVAQVVTCFTCGDVHFSFRGKQILGSMGPGLGKVLDAVVPVEDRRLATLQERLTPEIAKLVMKGAAISLEGSDGRREMLDGERRREFVAVISGNPRAKQYDRGGPTVTVRFADRKESMKIDFEHNSISVPSGFPSVSVDWNALRKCLLRS